MTAAAGHSAAVELKDYAVAAAFSSSSSALVFVDPLKMKPLSESPNTVVQRFRLRDAGITH